MELKTYEDITAEHERKIIRMLRDGNATFTKTMINDGRLPLDTVFTSNYHRSVLHFLVLNKNNNELLQWLLENKFDQLNLNAQDSTLSTPLMYAAEVKNMTAIKLLLAYGADVSIENNVKQKLIDIVEFTNYNAKPEVKRWIKQASEGTLLKQPISQLNTLVNRHPTPQTPTSPVRSSTQTPTTAAKTSSCSLWHLIERIKSPILGLKKKPASDTQPSLDEASTSMDNKVKKQ